ncbi:AraC family transcriptional regulator [Anaerobiospirillum succiniciproducens]|uniref:AraC family transcriptional regulator n=1 Tax=Anaerobiospirillum succiniciproducens TaxID=13335 RepID=UPI000424E6F2|nr:AraC family transcriptional regulator [Anaerobiospirillum succiniciproducens]MDO4675663.1 AraC family transcriptional regulator [Anaerobiospirillum succiniciproducens]
MQDIFLKESKAHGNISFPFAFYHVTEKHPRYTMETHWHEECEICRVLSGTLEVTIDGKTFTGKGRDGVGDIFIFNSGAVHSAIPHDCVYECVVFDLHFLLRERSLSNSFIYSLLYNQRKFVSYIPYTQEKQADLEDICSIVQRLFFTLRDQGAGYQLKSFGIMYYLLGLFEDKAMFEQPNEAGGDAVSRIMKMRMALSYIHRNYKQHISLSEIAELLDLQPPSVVKLFKELINKKPLEYINSYRINCAQEMLKEGRNSVTAVALECGFTDVSYFTKVFKKYTDQTPRQFITKTRENPDLFK